MVADDKIVVTTLIEKGHNPGQSKVLVMGIKFKEDVADIRNSKVVDLIKELMSYSLNVHVYDPWANPEEVRHEYGISSYNKLPDTKYDAVILAVAHKTFESLPIESIKKNRSVVFDVKAVLPKEMVDGRL